MSHFETYDIACEECGSENEYKEYKSVNATLDPELREAIMDDSIFRYECHSCHHVTYYHHPLLYHDMEHRFMIQYSNDLKEFKESLHLMRIEGMITDYTIRWTNNWYVFKEKIEMLEHQRDDRIISIYKDILLEDFKKAYPEAGDAVVFYDFTDEETMVVISEEMDPKLYAFPAEWYENKKQDPLIQKILHYDTTINVDEDYSKRLFDLRILVDLAEVETETAVKLYALTAFDEAQIGDHVLVAHPGAIDGHIEGIIRQLYKKDARDVPAGTPFIEKVLPEESQEDIINGLHLESLLGDIQDNIEETQLIELMDLLLDVKVSFPLIKDLSSGELENVVIEAQGGELFIPLFTNKDEAKEQYDDSYLIVEDRFRRIIDQEHDEIEGFLINPYSDYFVADHNFLELLVQYEQSKRLQVN